MNVANDERRNRRAQPAAATNLARHSIIEVGRELIAAKAEVRHGEWLTWLEQEFGWSDATARRYMQVADAFGKMRTVHDMDEGSIAIGALYALASPRVPQVVRDEAVERAEAGERITKAEAQAMIRKALEAEAHRVRICPPSAPGADLASIDTHALYALALKLKPLVEAKARANKQASGEIHGRGQDVTGKVHQKSDEPISIPPEPAWTAADVVAEPAPKPRLDIAPSADGGHQAPEWVCQHWHTHGTAKKRLMNVANAFSASTVRADFASLTIDASIFYALSPFARIEIVADIEALEAEKAKERQREAGGNHGNQHTKAAPVRSTLAEAPSEPVPNRDNKAESERRTRTRAAKAAKVSTGRVDRRRGKYYGKWCTIVCMAVSGPISGRFPPPHHAGGPLSKLAPIARVQEGAPAPCLQLHARGWYTVWLRMYVF